MNRRRQKRCFVVMGFGEKTDYVTGRKLDLNQSYRLLIKPVVEKKGFTCLRADEIKHSGVIDEVMYRELFQADLVIADLSTANLNAFYELGIRHALRPFTTIVISEDKLAYPFNLTHISIEKYQHLGADIGFTEVQRFRKVLGEKIDVVLQVKEKDSPIYTFLEDLVPPSLKTQTRKAIKDIEDAVQQGNDEHHSQQALQTKEPPQKGTTNRTSLSKLTEQGEIAIKKQQFAKAKKLFKSAFDLSISDSKNADKANQSTITYDTYIMHRLALSTFKAAKPDLITALKDALALLEKLDLQHTNDPETVALAGVIEKKLYEKKQGVEHLKHSILYHERGYYLLNSLYNMINLAYMFNCRADSLLDKTKEEKIADLVNAERIRKRVVEFGIKEYEDTVERGRKLETETQKTEKELYMKNEEYNNTQKFWIWCNLAEAYFGLGQFENYENARNEAKALPHEEWMIGSLDNQIKKLNSLLEKQGHLMNPQWKKL